MKSYQPIAITAAHSRWGRAMLHFVWLCRGGERRWHVRGMFRELFRSGNQSIVAHAADAPSESSHRGSSVLPAFLLATTFSAAAASGPVELELRSSAQADSAGIFLQQVASASPSALTPQNIRLADAPGFGRAASFTPDQLGELLRRAAPQFPAITWTGASQVRVVRRARFLAESELRDLLTATIQSEHVRDKGTLELAFGRSWPGVNLPDETLSLRVLNMPASGVSPNFIVRFDVNAGAERFGPWQVVAQARVMKDVLVARVPLKRGQPLQSSDFSIERRDVLSLREAVDVELAVNPAFELVENVPPGQPLLARAVRMRPVVQRGQLVDGLVRDGAMNISLKVEVLVDGLPGQTVRVRNPKTKREFYAKVQDEQTVVIHL